MGFFRKKVTYSEFIQGLSIIAISIRDDLLNHLGDILNNDYLFNKDKSWQNELNRREWELMFFVNSLITMKLETFKNKHPLIDKDFINHQAETYSKLINKNDYVLRANNQK